MFYQYILYENTNCEVFFNIKQNCLSKTLTGNHCFGLCCIIGRGAVPLCQTKNTMKDYSQELKQLCTKKKVYLQPDLTLSELADMLGTNRTYLSATFHEVLHTSFCGYINALRCAHAAKLLKKSGHTVKEVMFCSGFSHYNSFRNAFVAIYGCTPGEYQKRQVSRGHCAKEQRG